MRGVRLDVQPGHRFGRYAVLYEVERRDGRRRFLCRCDCGAEKAVRLEALRSGAVVSCGCYNRQISREANTKHGLSEKRVYRIWTGIKGRCLNPNNAEHRNYGWRGITICAEWMTFEPFHEWAMANGYRDDLTIERKDNDGPYSPDNCTWVPQEDQRRNTRRVQRVWLNGQGMTLRQWARAVGMHPSTLQGRLKTGIALEEALKPPVRLDQRIGFRGQANTVAEWSRITGIEDATIRQRLKRGWSIEQALTTPVLSVTMNHRP